MRRNAEKGLAFGDAPAVPKLSPQGDGGGMKRMDCVLKCFFKAKTVNPQSIRVSNHGKQSCA